MGAIEDRIKELGHTLPGPSAPGGNYVPAVAVPSAGLVYTAGNVARRPDGTMIVGKLGADLTVEQGYEAAKVTALNLLGVLKAELGDLDRVKQDCQAPVHGELGAGLRRPARGGQRCLGPLRRDLWRQGQARQVGRGHGVPARWCLRRDRDDRRGVVLATGEARGLKRCQTRSGQGSSAAGTSRGKTCFPDSSPWAR